MWYKLRVLRPVRLVTKRPVRSFMVLLVILVTLYSYLFWLMMHVFEGKRVGAVDAAYWTLSRLTTTGDSIARLAYNSRPVQVLSVLVQVSGLLLFFAALPLVILPLIERQMTRSLPEKIPDSVEGHVLICGYNDLVESLVEELSSGGTPYAVLDASELVVARLLSEGRSAILGDPSKAATLYKAGADRASYIIANLEDEENANVILAAAAVSEAEIVALVDELARANYYEYAGARQVLSPKELLGYYLAKKATASLRDEIFGENQIVEGLDVMELPIFPDAPIDGCSLSGCAIGSTSGASIVGIWHRGKLELEPGPRSLVSAENVIIAVGTREQLITLQRLTQGDGASGPRREPLFVVAGYGDVGRVVAQELRLLEIPYAMIDSRERAGEYIKGDATEEEILIQAGIKEATTFIVAGHVDHDNIFATLIARKINPHLHILARANSSEATDRLYRAGADFVFSLSAVAGQMLARMIQGDKMITLAEGLKVLSAPVPKSLAGTTIGQSKIRSKTGCTVIALRRADGGLLANPGSDARLGSDQVIVVLGSRRQVDKFRKHFKITRLL